jgi:SAM-dependent methyltransferase
MPHALSPKLTMETVHLIFHIRTARSKAREAASLEALCLLRDLGAVIPTGGPLSEKGQVFWVDLPACELDRARDRLPRLGYTTSVDLLEPAQAGSHSNKEIVRWRRRYYRLIRIYEEDPEDARERAPDRRRFMLETSNGEVRLVKGYRGDGGLLSRRGLPTYDACLLVNLVSTANKGRTLLDPFAGVGGIVLEALESGYRVVSCDIDPGLLHGLSHIGAFHHVADARYLPFQAETMDAIATEPPYSKQTEDLVTDALVEMHRVLKTGGRIAMMCADWQAERLRQTADSLDLENMLDLPIDRKGVDCVALAWQKSEDD